MATVVGLTLCKINNIYELTVKNATWSVKKAVQQHQTGGGVEIAEGLEVGSGTFDEVIPRDKSTDWRKLKAFSVEILDKEGKTTLAAFTECSWGSLDGSSDTGQANSGKRIAWVAKQVVKA